MYVYIYNTAIIPRVLVYEVKQDSSTNSRDDTTAFMLCCTARLEPFGRTCMFAAVCMLA